MDISKQAEEVDMSATVLESSPMSSPGDGVAPGVLAAVILGVLCVIGVMFSLAVLMDRWNRRLSSSRGPRGSGRSKKTTILNNMSPSPESDPPALTSSGPDNC